MVLEAYSYPITGSVTLSPELQRNIVDWWENYPDIPSRSQAIQCLVEAALAAAKTAQSDRAATNYSVVDLRNHPNLSLPRRVHFELQQSSRLIRFKNDNRLTSESQAIYHLVNLAFETLDAKESPEVPEPPRLLAPPAAATAPAEAPAEAPLPTLPELAALIRRCAAVNPFVRPLADLLDGRV